MNNEKLLRLGVAGTLIAALSCFTPLLVVLLGAVGLSSAVGWLDYVLVPAMAAFAALGLYAVWRRRSAAGQRGDGEQEPA